MYNIQLHEYHNLTISSFSTLSLFRIPLQQYFCLRFWLFPHGKFPELELLVQHCEHFKGLNSWICIAKLFKRGCAASWSVWESLSYNRLVGIQCIIENFLYDSIHTYIMQLTKHNNAKNNNKNVLFSIAK